MSFRRLAEHQPGSFAFTPENEERCAEILRKYPEGRAASATKRLLQHGQAFGDGDLGIAVSLEFE